jgi:tripartite-type tricarboxylate transporter receptor subunit TctC
MIGSGGLSAATRAAGMAGLLAATPALAQSYPTRAVEIVVPFAVGGSNDILARLVGEGLSRRLGQPFVPLNRPGANTNTGTLQVVKAAPDGHTLAMGTFGLAANPSLYRRLPFEPLRDLAPITLIATAPSLLVVPPSLPVNTVAELIAYLKARPGELNYASYGVGSSPHLGAELFQSMTGTRIVHVPYPGGGPASLGVMGNNVQMLLGGIPSVLGLVRGGQIKAIALAADRRSPLLPDVPTFIESGFDFRSGPWFGLLAPAKTPETIIATLHRETVGLLQEPAMGARIAEQGADVVASTPAEFRAFIQAETERLSTVIRRANIQLD